MASKAKILHQYIRFSAKSRNWSGLPCKCHATGTWAASQCCQWEDYYSASVSRATLDDPTWETDMRGDWVRLKPSI